ncbi:MAG: peptidylprolyl isomerase [Roseimicrobium sp.]
MNSVPIFTEAVASELRAQLWRQGETWDLLDDETMRQRRNHALDVCVEHQLMDAFAKGTPSTTAVARYSEEAFQQFLKQFETDDAWRERLAWQRLTEVEMRERMAKEAAQVGALEAWLQGEEKRTPAQIESEARAWFATHKAQLRVPERVRVSHLFLSGHDHEKPDRQAEIAELHRKLTAREATFERLAGEASEDERSKLRGGDLGWFTRERVPADFAAVIFDLPIEKVSAPFRTKLGWHIAVVHERRAARLPEYGEVRQEVLAFLESERRASALQKLMAQLRSEGRIFIDQERLQLVAPLP